LLPIEQEAPGRRLARLASHLAALEATRERFSRYARARSDPQRAAGLLVLDEEILIAELLLREAERAADEAADEPARPDKRAPGT
jgi:hypothetical protein